MNLMHQYNAIARKQLNIAEGINLLKQVQTDLNRTMLTANAWGFTAVIANASLIPLNVIINAFEIKKANSLYQALVRQVYDTYSKSGTRIDGHAKTALSILKKVVIEELKHKGMTDMIPGVNIIVGLAEDSLAFYKAAEMVGTGNQEMKAMARNLNNKIGALTRELTQLGIKRAQILERMQYISRNA
ncbi:hypothetical protein AAE02nite_18490 [Adhaeribacter aerolatus]|uniref:Uncharacterized protein n=1 Tax=Adhaeribacter aerolatus TaxID=670289 RepID=A0A512AWT1_9BACT|nr:hypothetical protein [Adhaeribacter aerolatus]GEO04185.1 hypothetical protein AAE02nite_18490 [Adhaeribacter aerolatus]